MIGSGLEQSVTFPKAEGSTANPQFTGYLGLLQPCHKRFFLRCCPKVVGSLAIGKLRVQTGAIPLRTTVTLRSQKGNIAH